MSLYSPPEQKELGKKHFDDAVAKHSPSRREFIQGAVGATAAVGLAAAGYFGYTKLHGSPVRTALIGTGDEGGVLANEHNPEFLEFVAVCDIRPTNLKRIFTGDPNSTARRGLDKLYGAQARSKVKQYKSIDETLSDPNVEAVVIALPLHLHAPVAIKAMEAGKHVLCEKLMAWNVAQCKKMIDVSQKTGKILTIGHQRHYSLLYEQALDVIKADQLGTIKHIRALWHRNNSWPELDANGNPKKDGDGNLLIRDGWSKAIDAEDREELQGKLSQLDYKSMEELVRWRLYQRTGGGLMAELGSHQLDACSIFLGKVRPLSVTGVGGKFFYKDKREIDDHVFVTYEFPGPKHPRAGKGGDDRDDVVVVTYSSINTNAFEPYGECVMGSRATLVVENEQTALLYPERNPAAKKDAKGMTMSVTSTGGGKPAVDTSATTGFQAAAGGPASVSANAGPVSRGYREEMEHFAFCVRMQQKETTDEGKAKWLKEPRCRGEVAMADAIIALTSNLAMKHKRRIEFEEEWFKAESPEVPDAENKVLDAGGKPLA